MVSKSSRNKTEIPSLKNISIDDFLVTDINSIARIEGVGKDGVFYSEKSSNNGVEVINADYDDHIFLKKNGKYLIGKNVLVEKYEK